MDSFYSGRPGKDFQIKSTFLTLKALNDDLNNPSTSLVAFNEYAIFDDSDLGRCKLLQKTFAKDLDQEKDYVVSGQTLGYKVIADIRGRGIEDINSSTEGDKTTYTITYTDGSTKAITIDAYDILSKSWAIGGTQVRENEETNNSKYYSGQSANSATAAAASAESATAAKTAAEAAKVAAEQYKSSAGESASSASSSARDAKSWAVGGTGTRGDKENTDNAKYYSEQASSSATAADQSKSDAIAAKGAAETAKNASEVAQGKAEDAQEAAETAQGKAETAQNAAEAAEKTANSWATGGTNSRPGEDTDNAKYYSKQASDSEVMAKSWAIGGTGKRINENKDNSKYYSEQAADQAKLAESWAIGGTNTRINENSNNAKYFSQQASNSASAADSAKSAAQSAAQSAQNSANGAASSASTATTAATTATDALQSVQNAKTATEGARDNAIAAAQTAESAKQSAIDARNKYPRIIDKTWWIWDPQIGQSGAYIDTGTKATASLELLGCFNTYEELKAAITDPKPGQAYGVGNYVDPESSSEETAGDIDIYIYGYAYDTTVEPKVLKLQWINYGKLISQEDTWILLPKKELQG